MITTDTQANVTFMNPVAEAMTGWSQQDALGRPLEEVFRVVNEETRAPVPNPVREVLRTGTVVGLANDSSLIRKDNAMLAIEDSAAPIRDTAGNISGCVMVFHDVTQRRRAERALRANEDRLRDSARRLQLAMSAERHGRLGLGRRDQPDVAEPARRPALQRCPANAPVSRDQLRALVPPEDGMRTKLEFDRALLEKTDYKVEFRILRGNGPPVWVAAQGSRCVRGPRRRGGHDRPGPGHHRAAPVPKSCAADFAAVVESSTDAVVSKTLESIITTWNQGAERLFGYKAEEVIGKPITILIPPEQLDEEPAILERIKSGEARSALPDRSPPQGRHARGRVARHLADPRFARPDHRRRRRSRVTSRRTSSAETALRETDRRKDEFLATLAHELRNPLAPIRQATLIAQSPNATEAQKRWSHEVINRQVHNMALLLDDLLDISRITRGTLALRTQTTDLATIVAAAVETARPLIDTKRHTLSVQLPTERVEFAADPMRLAQVLSNLLTNAAKYTDPDGRIGLTASCAAGDDHHQRNRHRHRHSAGRDGQASSACSRRCGRARTVRRVAWESVLRSRRVLWNCTVAQ